MKKEIKGNVFIGWNIKNDLANEVKAQLKAYGYNAIVGGKDNDELEHGVSATIISQMKKCSGAIMLFSPRVVDGLCSDCEKTEKKSMLSGNMLYELGFLTGSKKIDRVLTVFIDNAEKLAPSDIKGCWDYEVLETKTVDGKVVKRELKEVASDIVKVFLAEQKDSLIKNKMEMITDISNLRAILTGHTKNAILYENELATVVMLFCQSAYMLDDIPNSEKVLNDLLHSENQIRNENLLIAISSSFDYFDACRALTKDEYDNMYLPRREYKKLLHNLTEYIEETEERLEHATKAHNEAVERAKTENGVEIPEIDPFYYLFLAVAYDYISFINMMFYANTPKEDLDEDVIIFREESAKKSIEYSQIYREINPALNSQLCSLYESYTYRNLALFYRTMERFDDANEYFEKSIKSRRELYMYFKKRDLNQSVFDQINMEYHLALIDNIFDVDEEEKSRRRRELKNYVEDVSEASYNRQYLVEKISKILKQIRNS